jgi:hypothetical protein
MKHWTLISIIVMTNIAAITLRFKSQIFLVYCAPGHDGELA